MNKNYAVFPCKDINITQNYSGRVSHWTQSESTNGVKSYPIDICYGDTYLTAPCRMKSVNMTYFNDDATTNIVNQVWFQSTEPVYLANGEYDYITILATHPDDWDYSWDKVGTIYERYSNMVNQGTDGGVAAHLDIVVGVGLHNADWVRNSFGEGVLPNSRKPEDVFYIDPSFNVVYDTQGIIFKTLPSEYTLPSTVLRDENKNQIEVTATDLNVRKEPNTNSEVVIYPCALGIYDYMDVVNGWYKIKEDMWVNEIGLNFLPKKEEVIEVPIEKPTEEKPIENEEKNEETIDNSDESGIIDIERKKRTWYEFVKFILSVLRKLFRL